MEYGYFKFPSSSKFRELHKFYWIKRTSPSGLWRKWEYGIPYIVVDKSQPKLPINFTDYGNESDPGPYPIPLNAPIEGGTSSDGDRHVLAVDTNECKLYELYNAHPQASSWDASNGAVFDLKSNSLRPDYWTSADAAGLPVFAGLARYDEVAQGEIKHALRFTVSSSQKDLSILLHITRLAKPIPIFRRWDFGFV